MNSLVEENYLKALFHLSNNGIGDVNVKDLSEHLKIKMPTVNSMMKKLAEKDLVHYETYKPLRLTNQGILKAALIVRKHRLTEMFLVEKMGFGWDEVHEIAEQIEHIQSQKFFDKMDELLNYPKVDPHGSPIPDLLGNIELIHYKKLSDVRPGEVVQFSAVTHSSDEFLKYLSSKNIHLNDYLVVLSKEEFDQSMVLMFKKDGRSITFSEVVSSKLLVKTEY